MNRGEQPRTVHHVRDLEQRDTRAVFGRPHQGRTANSGRRERVGARRPSSTANGAAPDRGFEKPPTSRAGAPSSEERYSGCTKSGGRARAAACRRSRLYERQHRTCVLFVDTCRERGPTEETVARLRRAERFRATALHRMGARCRGSKAALTSRMPRRASPGVRADTSPLLSEMRRHARSEILPPDLRVFVLPVPVAPAERAFIIESGPAGRTGLDLSSSSSARITPRLANRKPSVSRR